MTNRHDLPTPIFKACQMDTHRMTGDISVTQLIDAPQIRMLKKRNKVEEDCSDKIWALLGTATHAILERANQPLVRERAYDLTVDTLLNFSGEGEDEIKRAGNYLKKVKPQIFFKSEDEEYLYEVTITLEIDGMVISGTFDLYHKATRKLQDYKVLSVWNYVFPEARKKFIAQLNCYAYMLTQEGFPVDSASVIMIFRDWSASKAAKEGNLNNKGENSSDYPPRMCMEVDVPLYPVAKMGEYMADRVRQHRNSEIGDLQECDGKERWASSDKYAMMVSGGRKAIRLLDNENDMNKYYEENKHRYAKSWIEKRPGENKRCAEYCPVSEFCNQYKKIKLASS